MQNQPVMGIAPILPRNRLLQPLLHLERSFSYGKVQTVRHTEHMGIDRNRGRVESNAHHNICRLAPNSWKFLQCFEIGGNLPTVFLQKDMAGFEDMLCLHAEEPAVMYRRFELHLPKCGNRFRRIRILKQPSRYHIHTHIRTLRRQNHRDEELERCLERESRLCIRIELPQDTQLLRLNGFRYSHISSSATSSARESAHRVR